MGGVMSNVLRESVVLGACAILLGLVGCASTDNPTPPEESATEDTPSGPWAQTCTKVSFDSDTGKLCANCGPAETCATCSNRAYASFSDSLSCVTPNDSINGQCTVTQYDASTGHICGTCGALLTSSCATCADGEFELCADGLVCKGSCPTGSWQGSCSFGSYDATSRKLCASCKDHDGTPEVTTCATCSNNQFENCGGGLFCPADCPTGDWTAACTFRSYDPSAHTLCAQCDSDPDGISLKTCATCSDDAFYSTEFGATNLVECSIPNNDPVNKQCAITEYDDTTGKVCSLCGSTSEPVCLTCPSKEYELCKGEVVCKGGCPGGNWQTTCIEPVFDGSGNKLCASCYGVEGLNQGKPQSCATCPGFEFDNCGGTLTCSDACPGGTWWTLTPPQGGTGCNYVSYDPGTKKLCAQCQNPTTFQMGSTECVTCAGNEFANCAGTLKCSDDCG